SSKNNPGQANTPPLLATSEPPPIAGPPPLVAGSPVPPSANPDSKGSSGRKFLVVLLSLCVALFVADGLVSLLDDSLILFFGLHAVSGVRGFVFAFALLITILVYVLMGLTPMIPKRLFLPVTLFSPALTLVMIPLLIYFYGRMQQIFWLLSLVQASFGFSVFWWLRRRSEAR